MTKQKRLPYFDFLRGIAIIMNRYIIRTGSNVNTEYNYLYKAALIK